MMFLPKQLFGQTVMTATVNNEVASNSKMAKDVWSALKKYANRDWGILEAGDKQLNDGAWMSGLELTEDGKNVKRFLPEMEDRILAKYSTVCGPIYIITEWDRSQTTIMHCDEY